MLTTVLFVDLGGKVLPIQCVWKGVLAASLLIPVTSRETIEKRHCFILNRQIYWSSFETTKA